MYFKLEMQQKSSCFANAKLYEYSKLAVKPSLENIEGYALYGNLPQPDQIK